MPPGPPTTAKAKRPPWKRWWFWTAAILVVLWVIGTVTGGGNEKKASTLPTITESAMAPSSTVPATATSPTASLQESPSPEPTPTSATVPKVTGMLSSTASSAVAAVGLDLKVSKRVPSKLPKDKVLSQQPAPGRKLDQGQTVMVVVSNGKVQLPSLVGKSATQAKGILRHLGLGVSLRKRYALSSNVVLSQSPQPGMVDNDKRVTITVSVYPVVGKPCVASWGTPPPPFVCN